MSLRITNVGTYSQLFDDLNTVMGTTLGWTLFDSVSADEKVYTVPTTAQGFGPAFIRLFRDNTLFFTQMTIYKTWTIGGGVAGATFPIPAVDSTGINRFDFTTGTGTIAYRIYAGAATDGYIAIQSTPGSGVSISMLWIGILQSVSTFALHPKPTAVIYDAGAGFPNCKFLDHLNVERTNTDAGRFFQLSTWDAATNPISGKSPIVSAFAWSPSSPFSISGFGKDLFYCSAALATDDIIQIGSTMYRVFVGGGTCILISEVELAWLDTASDDDWHHHL